MQGAKQKAEELVRELGKENAHKKILEDLKEWADCEEPLVGYKIAAVNMMFLLSVKSHIEQIKS